MIYQKIKEIMDSTYYIYKDAKIVDDGVVGKNSDAIFYFQHSDKRTVFRIIRMDNKKDIEMDLTDAYDLALKAKSEELTLHIIDFMENQIHKALSALQEAIDKEIEENCKSDN